MRILHVNHWLPTPPLDGGRLRKLQQLEALRREHDVVVLGRAVTAADRAWLEAHLAGIRVIEAERAPDGTAATTLAVRRALCDERTDALHVSGVPQWPGLRGLGSPRLVLDVDSIESRVLETLRLAGVADITPLDVSAVRALEGHAFAAADGVIACSEADAVLIRTIAPAARVTVVPNAIDVSSFSATPLGPPRTPPVITFTGFLAYRPNADACVHFVRDVLPHLRARTGDVAVRLVGRLPPADVHALTTTPGVDVIADVPDIRPYLATADVIVVPLRAGSGTRLKILEAFAAGRPVVSTALGCEGLDVADGTHLLIADDAAAFAGCVARLLHDRILAASLTAAARELAAREYDRRVVEDRILAVYRALPDGAASVRRDRLTP